MGFIKMYSKMYLILLLGGFLFFTSCATRNCHCPHVSKVSDTQNANEKRV